MTPDTALRHHDGEYLDIPAMPDHLTPITEQAMRESRRVRSGDIHKPQLRYMLPALVVGAVVALVWMVLAK